MRITAYTYLADVHCPACTKLAAQHMKVDHCAPYALGFSLRDEHGLEYDLRDREGGAILPVFDIEENDFTHCGDCREELS